VAYDTDTVCNGMPVFLSCAVVKFPKVVRWLDICGYPCYSLVSMLLTFIERKLIKLIVIELILFGYNHN
jgi:hypothetical protein